MKKILTGALAALTVGGGALASVPASAEPHGGYGGSYGHHDHDGGAAVAAGIAGLAIGAALASGHDGYYGRPAYYAPPPAYYAGPAYYSYSGRCHTAWRWDRYWGRYTRVRACY